MPAAPRPTRRKVPPALASAGGAERLGPAAFAAAVPAVPEAAAGPLGGLLAADDGPDVAVDVLPLSSSPQAEARPLAARAPNTAEPATNRRRVKLLRAGRSQ